MQLRGGFFQGDEQQVTDVVTEIKEQRCTDDVEPNEFSIASPN